MHTCPLSASREMVASSTLSGVSVVLSMVLLSTCGAAKSPLSHPTEVLLVECHQKTGLHPRPFPIATLC